MKASIGIAAELRARIARGDLAHGEPLPVEDLLVLELGCSKPVVREALRILETEGLVEVRRGVGGGARVRHPSISHAAETMGVYLQIGDVPVVDVWSARDRIVAAAIERLGAEGADPAGMAAAIDDMAAAVGDLPRFNARLLDAGEAAVLDAGNRTEHVLVAALRHIVATEIAAAASRVVDDAGLEVATKAELAVVEAWERTLQHVRRRRPVAARRAYESQADALRELVGAGIADLTVGDAAVAAARG